MKQTEKLDNLIVKILKEELEEKKVFVTKDGKTLSPAQQQELQKTPSGETVEIRTQGKIDSQKEDSEDKDV